MVNNMMEFLSDVPPTLAAGWATWIGTGALLVMWYRKAKANLDAQSAPAVASRTVASARTAPRATAMAEPRVTPESRPVAVAVPRPKPSPLVVGDPFGDLATLLDQPTESAPPAPAPAYRTPGDSPILNSAGSPVLRNSDPDPKY